MRNDESWRVRLEKLEATAEREDPTEGYLLDECRNLARGLTDFLDGRWQASPEEMFPWLRERIFCAVSFGKQIEAMDTLAESPELRLVVESLGLQRLAESDEIEGEPFKHRV